MSSSIPRPLLFLAAATIVLASFFVTLKVLDYLGTTGQTTTSPIKMPAYRAETLPHLKAGQILVFTNGQNRDALVSGWSNSEPGGVWSDGHAAFIGFVADGTARVDTPRQAIVRADILLVPGQLTEQHIQVWSDNKKLAEYALNKQPRELRIPLGDINVSNSTPVILGFYMPDAVVVKTLLPGSSEMRALGLRLFSLQLSP